jgi:hypothetical protein
MLGIGRNFAALFGLPELRAKPFLNIVRRINRSDRSPALYECLPNVIRVSSGLGVTLGHGDNHLRLFGRVML